MTLRWIGFFELLGRPVSQHGVALAVATLPWVKGQRGCVHGEAWCEVRGLRSSTQSGRCCADYTRQLQRGVRGCIGMKKLDLKSNCATSTPYIVLRVSHN